MQAPRNQCELEGEQVEMISIWKHGILVVMLWSLRLLGIVFMLVMTTLRVVREMHWSGFG